MYVYLQCCTVYQTDLPITSQVHNLPKAKLDKRDVVHVDIVNDHVSSSVSEHTKYNRCLFSKMTRVW